MHTSGEACTGCLLRCFCSISFRAPPGCTLRPRLALQPGMAFAPIEPSGEAHERCTLPISAQSGHAETRTATGKARASTPNEC